MKYILTFSLIIFFHFSDAQNIKIELKDSLKRVSLRGLSVVNDAIIWASGSNGTVAKSIDGGKTFEWKTVKGYEKRDFRDIEVFDANTAIIIGIAEPAIILKTIDGGQSWKKVFEDSTKGMFLDAVDFDEKGNGMVIGDPINGCVFSATTTDFGETWNVKSNFSAIDSVADGEAFFASSGSNIVYPKKNASIFVTGGKQSRLNFNNRWFRLPILQGKESTGANSIAIFNKKAVVVGGDFAKDKDTTGNCVLINLDKKPTFYFPQKPPKGYKSSVIFINSSTLVTCGTSGVDVSIDGGINWKNISTESYHVVEKSKKGNAIFLAGSRGKIAQLFVQ